jgi:outer membrane protein TolC
MQKRLFKLLFLGMVASCATGFLDAEDRVVGRGSTPLPQAISLQAAIDYAIEHSFAVLQAKERIQEQYGLYLEVKSGVLPNLSLSSRYSEQDQELVGFQGAENDWSVSIRVRQALYSGGSLKASIRAQGALEDAALYELQVNIQATIQEVKTRYYDVVLARDTIEVETQNIELLNEQLANIQSRFEAGAVSHFDVLQAQVSLANAKPALIRAKNNYRVAVAELKQSVGYMIAYDPEAEALQFTDSLVAEVQEYELFEAIHLALQQRPELAQLKCIIDAHEDNIAIARSDYYPSVDFVGSYDFRRSYFATDGRFDNSINGWFAGIESVWNIWDGRATKGRVVQAKSQMRQDELKYNETRLQIEVEVRRAISELQGAAELLVAAQQVTCQANESLRMANERYTVGSSTYLDTLQARVALTDARNNELQANYSYLVSIVNVQHAIGETQFNLTN